MYSNISARNPAAEDKIYAIDYLFLPHAHGGSVHALPVARDEGGPQEGGLQESRLEEIRLQQFEQHSRGSQQAEQRHLGRGAQAGNLAQEPARHPMDHPAVAVDGWHSHRLSLSLPRGPFPVAKKLDYPQFPAGGTEVSNRIRVMLATRPVRAAAGPIG